MVGPNASQGSSDRDARVVAEAKSIVEWALQPRPSGGGPRPRHTSTERDLGIREEAQDLVERAFDVMRARLEPLLPDGPSEARRLWAKCDAMRAARLAKNNVNEPTTTTKHNQTITVAAFLCNVR